MLLRSTVLLAVGLLAAAPGTAALPPVGAGERVVFTEDFADNRNTWSAVAVLGKTGKPANGQAALADSCWTPSIQDSGAVLSTAPLKPAIKLQDGPVSVYFAASVANPEGTEGNRFGVAINEAESARGFVRLIVRPAASAFLEYRDIGGAGQSASIQTTQAAFTTGSGPRNFKFTITPSADGRAPATAEAFAYDPKTKAYVSLGAVQNLVSLKTGEFQSLTLFSRNGDQGVVWIDSVVITQSAARR